MARRRVPLAHNDPSAGWQRFNLFRSASGRRLEAGGEFSVHGEPGRFRFVEHVVSASGAEWVTGIGGPRKVNVCRSFRPERIKRVHIKRERMTDQEARRLVNEKNRVKREGAT